MVQSVAAVAERIEVQNLGEWHRAVMDHLAEVENGHGDKPSLEEDGCKVVLGTTEAAEGMVLTEQRDGP